MARVTIEDCLDNVESRFSLVHLAVSRVLQLRGNAPPLVNAPKNKEVVVALREIAAGRVHWENIKELEDVKGLPESASKAKEEATRREVEEILETEAAPQYDASAGFEELDADAAAEED
ncbi:MAG: DNA-directed RNA polymerase subunit omega [Syntrophobacteraceae bacterium]|jgi:DNA-directed RNA polymerase subunit omega|nr:DNA-directed RNA polymerase subunit omega [Syntrophobacteraceae bacterium]